MKTIAGYIAGFISALAFAAAAASITITTDASMDARLAVAFGAYLHPGRNATTAEVKDWTIEQYRTIVRNYEDGVAKAAVAPPAAFNPS